MPRKKSLPKKVKNGKKRIYISTEEQQTNLKVSQGDRDENYVEAKKSKVEDEIPAGEVVIKFIQKWSPLTVATGILIAIISVYISFQNDIANSKTDIEELKGITKKNDSAIREIEKGQAATNSNLSILATNNKNLNDEIEKISINLRTVEIEQAKTNHTH